MGASVLVFVLFWLNVRIVWLPLLTAALPPRSRIRIPAWFASGWDDDTIPFVLWTTLRRDGNGVAIGSVVADMAGCCDRVSEWYQEELLYGQSHWSIPLDFAYDGKRYRCGSGRAMTMVKGRSEISRPSR